MKNNLAKINVVVLFGGKSVEHEVSVISAVQAMNAMNRERYEIIPVYITKTNEFFTGDGLGDIAAYKDIPALLKTCRRVGFHVRDCSTFLDTEQAGVWSRKTSWPVDVAFPIVHGTNGEDGTLQGFLETMNLAYVGPGVLPSAVGMDKAAAKTLLRAGGFPVLPDLCFTPGQAVDDEIVGKVEATFAYPVIVKPVNLGSSVGIGKADNAAELRECCDVAFRFARRVLVEPAVPNLREINCSVLGDAEDAQASECEEPVMSEAILSYEDKYVQGEKTGGAKGGMASAKRLIPAPVSDERREQIRSLAVNAFQYLDLAGVTRVDFLMDGATSQVWINEVNTIPGSLAFYLWEPVGVSYPDLLDRLITLALKRHRQAADLSHAFDTNILASAKLGTKGALKR